MGKQVRGERAREAIRAQGTVRSVPAPKTQQPNTPPKLLDRLREALRSRHYSRKTEQSYCHWVKRFIRFHKLRHPANLGEPEINAFLSHLALKRRVSASTQTQALSAILFLYRRVLKQDIGNLGEVIRARRPKRLPVVMTRDEVKSVVGYLEDQVWLAAALMYGAGLRLMECLRLRVQDIDFKANQVIVRDGKGFKDRVTMLPQAAKRPLVAHLRDVKSIHEQDLAEGYGRVHLPYALARKYPNAPCEWRWQFVFPQKHRWVNAGTGEQGRHHVDESIIQRAMKAAVKKAGLTKRASSHTLRHYAESRIMPSRFKDTGYPQRTWLSCSA